MLPGRDADLSPPSNAVVREERGYTSSPPMRQNWHETGELHLSLPLDERFLQENAVMGFHGLLTVLD
jgi:hypothetical protein